MQELISRGLVLRYEGTHHPKVWVTEPFLMLSLKGRNSLLGAVWWYYAIKYDEFGMSADGLFRYPLVVKIDDGTINGKRIAKYDPIDGMR